MILYMNIAKHAKKNPAKLARLQMNENYTHNYDHTINCIKLIIFC